MSNYALKSKVEAFYRSVFADLSVDREEAQELIEFFQEANPPPDVLVSLRASAFRIGCEFLTDDKDTNVAILKAINAIVHALESARMQPKPLEGTDDFDDANVDEFLQNIFSDLSVNQEENTELMEFFASQNPPPPDKLVYCRSSAFRIGSDFLGDDKETNIKLLRCINVVVHAFETSCFMTQPYELQVEVSEETSIASIGLDASLCDAVQHLWDLDANRLSLGTDIVVNVQSGKKPFHQDDAAHDSLFTSVDESQFQSRPTYRSFCALLDNFKAETGDTETLTDSEQAEIKTFLRAVLSTAPMQFCHKYCLANAQDIPSDKEGFMDVLYDIWFKLYGRSRGGPKDSSGFEHVFVGEVKDDKVSGFHNWIQLYMEEKKGALDYRGYIKPRGQNDAVTNDDDHILTLQFSWNGVEKAVGTSFIGTSPEFEMALYTVCFLVGGEENRVKLDTGVDVFDLNIRCYRMGSNQIGTSFPEANSHYED